jgi:hypothetical protein
MCLSPQVMIEAQNEAMSVYQKAGSRDLLDWCKSSNLEAESSCQDPPSATHLRLRVVSHASKVSDGVLGVAFLSADGRGVYGDVSYNAVEDLDRKWHVRLARVLGHVMAHELGHLLLGLNAHSRQGIMCPCWHGDELHLANTGSLLFSEDPSSIGAGKISAPSGRRTTPVNYL